MIKSITIQNFQSWKNATFDFSKGLNIFLGKTCSGKTAVLRALEWLVTNKPGGETFRSHWGGDVSVKVVVDDHTITRLRGKTTNQYILDGAVLKAMGQNVPEEVAEILNMDDINWHKQHDSAFLISETSGEVARKLNKVAKLDSIDTALTSINSVALTTNTDLKHEKKTLEELKEKASRYDYLEDMERDIRAVEKLVGQRTGLHEKHVRVASVIKEIETLTRSRVELKLPTTATVDRLLAMCDKVSRLKKQRSSILAIIDDIINLKKKIKDSTVKIEYLEAEFKESFPEQCPLCGQRVK